MHIENPSDDEGKDDEEQSSCEFACRKYLVQLLL